MHFYVLEKVGRGGRNPCFTRTPHHQPLHRKNTSVFDEKNRTFNIYTIALASRSIIRARGNGLVYDTARYNLKGPRGGGAVSGYPESCGWYRTRNGANGTVVVLVVVVVSRDHRYRDVRGGAVEREARQPSVLREAVFAWGAYIIDEWKLAD